MSVPLLSLLLLLLLLAPLLLVAFLLLLSEGDNWTNRTARPGDLFRSGDCEELEGFNKDFLLLFVGLLLSVGVDVVGGM
jgi:hypothetical protein